MNVARVAVMGVAIGAGVLAAVLALNFTRQPAPQTAAPVVQKTVETANVLVAASEIPTGTRIAENMLRWEEWPVSGISDRFLTQQAKPEAVKETVGSLSRSTFYPGEPITEAKLIRGDGGFMAAILPEGKRAIATRIAVETSAGGFILPNDRVDVIMTRPAGDAPGGYSSETILNNVKVLAIDQTLQEQDGQKVVVGSTATLELDRDQVQILTVAQQMGERLTLALRSLSDARSTSEGPDAKYLVGGAQRDDRRITVVRGGVSRDIIRAR